MRAIGRLSALPAFNFLRLDGTPRTDCVERLRLHAVRARDQGLFRLAVVSSGWPPLTTSVFPAAGGKNAGNFAFPLGSFDLRHDYSDASAVVRIVCIQVIFLAVRAFSVELPDEHICAVKRPRRALIAFWVGTHENEVFRQSISFLFDYLNVIVNASPTLTRLSWMFIRPTGGMNV